MCIYYILSDISYAKVIFADNFLTTHSVSMYTYTCIQPIFILKH